VADSSAIRVGFIGSGVIAWAHALSLRALVRAGIIEAELTAVYDLDNHRARSFGERLGLEAMSSADEVAAATDAVFVCTSTAGHLPAVEAVARHRRALFCEKPLGRSLEEATALVEVVELAGVPAQAGLVLRTAPVFIELQRLVAAGELGRPMVATFRDDQFFPVQGHYASTWRKDATEAGSGAVLEHSIHDLDVMRMCFGSVTSLSATNENFGGNPGIEDAAAGVLSFESGLRLTLVSVWHSVLERPSSRRVEVFFERGFVFFDDDFAGPITVQTDEGSHEYRCDPEPYVDEVELSFGRTGIGVRPYLAENRNFIDALIAGRPPSPSLGDALATHRLVDGWYQSAAAGGRLVVGPF
jgi:predicted dehydrogenase